MRFSKRAGAIAVTAAVVLGAAGCGSNDDNKTSGKSTADAAIVIEGVQPQNPLVPSNTTETGGGKVVDFMWTGLVMYPNDGSAPKNAVAESIETTDSQVYTVKIKKGTKFHDGTEVKAKNFVDAWNWAAYAPNGASNADMFKDIKGFEEVHPADPDGEGAQKAPAPKAEKLSGLEIVDDYTFKITLGTPFSIFPTKLGYSAFMPLPDVFFTQKDAQAFGKKPIGNGPVKFVSWTDNVEIKLTRFDDYTLDDKVQVKDVNVKLYQDDNAAYQDLVANNLDFMQVLPVSALAGDKWKTDLGDRAMSVPVPASQIIGFPIYDKRFQNAKLRRAISMSINRQEIAEKIFFNTRTAATSWSNPLAPGSGKDDCTACQFNPDEAKKLLQEAGGFSGELVFYYNADASHKDWMEAVAQSVKNSLGINARAEGIPTFAVFRQQIDEHKMTGPYRAGWQQDYPDVENWIGPLYVTGGGSNDGLYSNPQVDALYKEGISSKDAEAAHAKFAEATKIIDQDVPAIPMLFQSQQSGTSERVTGVQTTNVGEIDLSSVKLK